MAFQLATFKTRALTAIIFVVVMLVGLFWNSWSYFILFSIVHFGAWTEYRKLTCLFHPPYLRTSLFHRVAMMVAGWCLMLFFTHGALHIGDFHFQQAALWTGIILLVLVPLADLLLGSMSMSNLGYSLAGLIYISLPLALMIDLRNRWDDVPGSLAMTIPLLIIFSIWINDTMAYIVGSFIGKTPLSKISPKKTWEGTAGGVVLTIIVICLLAYFTKRISVTDAGILAGLAAISGTIGDLFESKLKRMAGVKDSGSFMPGHGGFLDRFDSLLFAATVVWFYTYFMIH